jgi:uncharacterized protein
MIKQYADFISYHPYLVIAIMLAVCAFSIYEAQTIKIVSEDNRDFLPDGYEVVDAFDLLENSFGGSQTAMIAVRIDPAYAASTETRDVRDPDIMRYVDLLTQMGSTVDDVTDAQSATVLLKDDNDGILPLSKRETLALIDQNKAYGQYISPDHTVALIKFDLSDDYSEDAIASDLQDVVDQVRSPPGVAAMIAGEPVTGPVITQALGPDQNKTSLVSLIAIIVILVLLLRSFIYAVGPIVTLIAGIILTMGYIGLRGLDLTPTTSGVISMILGIGIDFGIQTVVRFREEYRKKPIEEAMSTTVSNVFLPMSTTTLSALIGFKAMTMGELKFIGELGTMMSYGITACFIAAVTLLPALMIVIERWRLAWRKRK